MSQQQNFLSQINYFNAYLEKNKIKDTQENSYTLKLVHAQNGSKYLRTFIDIFNLPQNAQRIFTNLKHFIQILKAMIKQAKPSAIWIDQTVTLHLKIPYIIFGEVQQHILVQITMSQSQQKFDKTLQKMEKLYNKISHLYGQKQPQTQSKSIQIQKEHLQIQKQSKKSLKQTKQNQKSMNQMKKDGVPNQKFNIQDKKIVINQQLHRIEATLTQKSGLMSVTVLIHARNTNLTYTGQLSDIQIKDYLYAVTKLRNSKDLFQEIKRNAKKQREDTMKINQKQNKLEIFIVLPSKESGNSQNQKQQSIFAEIDIKHIKQQHYQDYANNLSSKENIKEKQKQKRQQLLSHANTKTKIIQSIKAKVSKEKNDKFQSKTSSGDRSNEKDQKINQISSKLQKSSSKQKDKFDAEKQFSQISFKSKKTVRPKSKAKQSVLNATMNESSMDIDIGNSADISYSVGGSKRSKSSKGFLLNKQHSSFEIRQKSLSLKENGISCALLSKKIPKRNVEFQFLVRIKKISDLFIVGVASQQVGRENNFLHQYFIGYSPLTGILYQNGQHKQIKSSNNLKQLRQNSVIKVKINLKAHTMTWLLKLQDISSKQSWKNLKQCLLPHFMQLKDLFPTIFLKKAEDHVQIIIPK